MGSGSSKSGDEHDVPEIDQVEEFDRVSTAAPNPQLGGGKKRTRNYTVKSKPKRRQTRRQK
jgi:hypothetical protein